jgi:alpha-L-rhamnosidase
MIATGTAAGSNAADQSIEARCRMLPCQPKADESAMFNKMRLAFFLLTASLQASAMGVRQPRTEYLSNPMAVETQAPRFTWLVESPLRGDRQTAYRILVGSSARALAANQGDLWDSGRVAGSETVNIAYAGKALRSGQQCFWKVQVWDKAGKPSAWSAPASWSMGLLQPADWKAEWISYRDNSPLHRSRTELYLPAARYFRKPFTAAKAVRRAVLYGSALGIFDAYVNGRRVSDAMFSPGWPDYQKRAYYRAWDVTSLVAAGSNALAAELADGWYAGYVGYGLLVGYGPNKAGRYFYGKTPALRLQLELEYADGSRAIVITDNTWKVTASATTEADIIMGEARDARREIAGWNAAGFDAAAWEPAIRAGENGSTRAVFSDKGGDREVDLGFAAPSRMQAYTGPDVRPIEEIKPVRILEPSPGTFVFDLGQNFSGVARLAVKGPAGTRIKLRFAEMIYPGGRVMTENLRRARATDFYTLRGDPVGETWTPRFTYHGFQYVEVTGYPGKPGPEAITGVVVHSATPLTGSLSSSDEMTNKLYRNIVWTQRSNFVELPTDCPQRDERLGWTGDAQIYVRAATFSADTAAFYTKWLDDLEEAQRPNGAYPDYAPYPMQHGSAPPYGTAWMDAGIVVPYGVWMAYGDTRLLERHWASMTRFMEFRRARSPEGRGVNDGNTWGDWLAIGSTTPIEFVDAAYYAYSARLMAEMAAGIGKRTEAQAYRDLCERVRAAFQKDYLAADGALKVDTQTAYALALANGLFPDNFRASAATHLESLIAGNGFHMTTGFLGTYPLLPVLTAAGKQDVAARLFQSREFPSWGYEVENGATTIWERWNSYTKDKGFFEPSMNSYSHYSFGAVSEWMFRALAGIDSDGPGFRKLVIKPGPPAPGSNPSQKPIDWVKAEYASVRGTIAVNWRRNAGSFELEVTVPANTTATVAIPAAAPVTSQPGAVFREMRDGRAWLEVESGTYRFTSRL